MVIKREYTRIVAANADDFAGFPEGSHGCTHLCCCREEMSWKRAIFVASAILSCVISGVGIGSIRSGSHPVGVSFPQYSQAEVLAACRRSRAAVQPSDIVPVPTAARRHSTSIVEAPLETSELATETRRGPEQKHRLHWSPSSELHPGNAPVPRRHDHGLVVHRRTEEVWRCGFRRVACHSKVVSRSKTVVGVHPAIQKIQKVAGGGCRWEQVD